MIEILLLAVGLAMDATAASAGIGAAERTPRLVVAAAALFGLFQAGMTAIGWVGGVTVATWAAAWDHWLAFFLLLGIGLHMLWEAWSHEPDDRPSPGLLALLGLAVATSIDALAAGLTLPVLGVGGAVAIGTIGIVTTALSLAGGLLGHWLGDRFGAKLEIAGGLVLIGIGVKVLVEHTIAGT